MSDPCLLTLAEQSTLIARRALSAIDLTEAYLARIAARDGSLRSYITVAAEMALQQARDAQAEIDRTGPRSPLHGIPIGIKDLIDVAGLPTTAAAAHRRNHLAATDAAVVANLRRAGAIILGKQNTAEYAVGGTQSEGTYPSPRNPWNLACDASSSSSGSAVAVAAGLCAGAVGTETAGSIRTPAAWCGVAGLKPTEGLVPTHGVLPLSRTMDCVGPLARTAEDCAILLAGMISPALDGRTSASLRPSHPKIKLRLGIPRHIFEDDPDLDAEMRHAFAQSLSVLRDLGHTLHDVTLPGYDTWADTARAITWPEEYAEHWAELRNNPDRFGSITRARLQDGLRFTAPDYVLALCKRDQAIATLKKLFCEVDLLVLPTMKTPAQPFGYEHQPTARDFSYTRPFNLTATPALTLCNGFTQKGMPLSMQFIGPAFEEATVLNCAIGLEKSVPSFRHGSDDVTAPRRHLCAKVGL